jgi:hypothetical protein
MAFYEAGTYVFKVTNQGFSESKDKKTPFFFLEGEPIAVVANDEQQPVDQSYQRTISLYITQKTHERVIEELRNLGWEGRKFGELDLSNPKAHSFLGQEIVVQCRLEPYDGGVSEKWELPYNAQGREPQKSDVKVASKLDAMFGKTLAKGAVAKQQASTAARREEVAAGNRNGDDVPF